MHMNKPWRGWPSAAPRAGPPSSASSLTRTSPPCFGLRVEGSAVERTEKEYVWFWNPKLSNELRTNRPVKAILWP